MNQILGWLCVLFSFLQNKTSLVRAFAPSSQARGISNKFSVARRHTHHVDPAVGMNLSRRDIEGVMTLPHFADLFHAVSLQLFKKWTSVQKYRKTVIQNSRKMAQILVASCIIYMGAGISFNSITPRAHASSAHSFTQTSRTKDQITLNRMVDKYVKRYMFQDDVYDSFESTYRELYTDATSGKYPSVLAETASIALGRNKDVQRALKVTSFDPEKIFFDKMSVIQDKLLNRYGISKTVSRPVLFMFGIVVPLFSVFFLATTFALNQKAMTERMAVRRYGESVLSAEEKPEEDDEEEEVDEEDDEENEDEEDSDNGDNKVRF
jgi:hypothetical protein